MPNMNWSALNSLQIGRYGEYYTMMEFASYGYDVYSSEVDDHGVDFIAKLGQKYFEVQVKSMRNSSYVFIEKAVMDIQDESRLVCLLRFIDGALPEVYVIPATAWQNPNSLLVDREYKSLKSKPEYGIQFSRKNNDLLEQYSAVNYFNIPNIENTTV